VRRLLRHLFTPGCLTELLQAFQRYQGHYKRKAHYLQFFAENEPKAKNSLRHKKFGKVPNFVCWNLLHKLTRSFDSFSGYLRNYERLRTWKGSHLPVSCCELFWSEKKTTNTSVGSSSCLVQDSLEYEPGVPTLVPRRSVIQGLCTEAFWSPVWWYRARISR
jgi:hypothetical protein